MNQIDEWLEETKSRAAMVSEAYRLELGQLWVANLCFVVLPAVFSTAAAILAAIPEQKLAPVFSAWLLPPASVLAGLAAVLVTIHKSLKCDEYQAECLRLMQRYRSMADSASSALSRPDGERTSLQQELAKELKELTENVKARLPTRIMRKAKKNMVQELSD